MVKLPKWCRECHVDADWTVSIGGEITATCDKHMERVVKDVFEHRTNLDLRGVFLIRL